MTITIFAWPSTCETLIQLRQHNQAAADACEFILGKTDIVDT